MTEGLTILVVDDEDAGRFVKVQTLKRAGFNVVEASTGTDALALVSSARPDLIVLDVHLPDISGLEVTRRLRLAHVSSPAIQILQISNTAITVDDQVRGLEQGADVYLIEPVDGQVLVATVQSLLRVRRAEAALAAALDGERRARELAEEASRLKDEFIATLSHELRTPLNALMGWIWQLRHRTLDAATQERAFESLERNTRMQAQLINDLLDVSRASKGKLQLEVRIVPLERVVNDALESVAEPIAERQLDLRLKLEPAQVVGDPARLQQIVTNLLSNAVQFSPVGGRVSVTLAASNEVVLTVEDSGAGIDPAFLPYVFDQFRQGDRGMISKHGGLGLGLAVVRQLVDLHGGSVTVTSAGLGRGATFIVRLPRELQTSEFGQGTESPRLLDAIRVRLIADEGTDPNAVKAILESSGAEVTTATAVTNFDDPALFEDVDLIVRQAVEGGPMALRRTAHDSNWQTIPGSSRPVDMVRRMARVAGRGPR